MFVGAYAPTHTYFIVYFYPEGTTPGIPNEPAEKLQL